LLKPKLRQRPRLKLKPKLRQRARLKLKQKQMLIDMNRNQSSPPNS